MKDINQLLEELAQQEANLEKGESELTELEQRRIYARTMEKIEKERDAGSTNGKESGEKISFWKKYSRIAATAAAVGVVCMISVTAVAAFGLDQNIKNFFHIQDKATEKEAEKLVSKVDARAVSNGVEISVSQIIGDKTRFYAVLKVKGISDIPGELDFEEAELTEEKTGKKYDYTMNPELGGQDGKMTKVALLVSGINENGEAVDITGKSVNFTLKNIGYYGKNNSFVPVVKGNWNLSWTFREQIESKKVDVNRKVQLMDSKGIWKDIEISPLSLTVHYNITHQGKTHFSEKEWEKYESSNRLTVQFTDGTRTDSRFAEDVNESWGSKEELGYKSIGFQKIVEEKEIQSVTFGGKTVVIHQSKKPDTRTRITSKSVNCSIALPKEVSKIITLEEKTKVKNTDFRCKESYTIFWGKKNNVRMPLFTIHRLKGVFSETDVEEKNPMMTYIGYRGGYTYTIEYGEIQNEEQNREFPEILNTYISNVLPYFEYLS